MEYMDFVNRVPAIGDEVLLSTSVYDYLLGSLYDEAVTHQRKCVISNIAQSFTGTGIVITINCNGITQEFWLKTDGTPMWPVCRNETWCVFIWPDDNKSVASMSITKEKLKELNTTLEATNCGCCRMKLKDPGLGPKFKYCPKCEP